MNEWKKMAVTRVYKNEFFSDEKELINHVDRVVHRLDNTKQSNKWLENHWTQKNVVVEYSLWKPWDGVESKILPKLNCTLWWPHAIGSHIQNFGASCSTWIWCNMRSTLTIFCWTSESLPSSWYKVRMVDVAQHSLKRHMLHLAEFM